MSVNKENLKALVARDSGTVATEVGIR